MGICYQGKTLKEVRDFLQDLGADFIPSPRKVGWDGEAPLRAGI